MSNAQHGFSDTSTTLSASTGNGNYASTVAAAILNADPSKSFADIAQSVREAHPVEHAQYQAQTSLRDSGLSGITFSGSESPVTTLAANVAHNPERLMENFQAQQQGGGIGV